MQDRYVGDIGDFGKYGLLRSLFGPPHHSVSKLKIGINWYLVPDEQGNFDGKHISYLVDNNHNHKRFKNCDGELYKKLQKIVKPREVGGNTIATGERKVSKVEKGEILPNGTIFYNSRLSLENITNRLKEREEWVAVGFEKLKDCDVIFFDPDNGFPPYNNNNNEKGYYSPGKHQERSRKYVYYDELVEYYEGGQSLIIYQHRTMESENRYLERFKKITEFIPQARAVFRLRWHPFSVRDYVFVLQRTHIEEIKHKITKMLGGEWGRHFSEL